MSNLSLHKDHLYFYFILLGIFVMGGINVQTWEKRQLQHIFKWHEVSFDILHSTNVGSFVLYMYTMHDPDRKMV